MKKQWRRILPITVLATTSLASIAIMSRGAEEATPSVMDIIRPVYTETVSSERDYNERYYGIVASQQRTDLAFRTRGRIIEILVSEGEQVRKGDVLAKLDPKDAQLTLRAARIDANNSKKEFDRANKLFKHKGAISRAQFDEISKRYELATNKVNEAVRNLNHTTLKAPFDGYIARRLVTNHSLVQTDEPVMTLHDLENLEVVINIPAQRMRNEGTTHDAYATVRNIPNHIFDLTMSKVETEPDPVTQTYSLTYRFNNLNQKVVLPGMHVEVLPILDSTKNTDAFTIPLVAVQPDNLGNQFVWIVNENNTLEKRNVEVGAINLERVFIKNNLTDGDKVVIAGFNSLEEGISVRSISAEGNEE